MIVTNESINRRLGEPVPLIISTVSPPTESHCHVIIYENERGNEKRGLIRCGTGVAKIEIEELFGPNGCESCCFCCSYGKLTSIDIANAQYEMRFLGTGRLGRRWRDTQICQSCYVIMRAKEEQRHKDAMEELSSRYGAGK